MNLYESKIEFKAEQMLGSMIELSGIRSSQSKTPYTDLDQYLTVFSFGRQGGHTTAVCNWIKNSCFLSQHLIVLVIPSYHTLDFMNKEHQFPKDKPSLIARNVLVVSASSSSFIDLSKDLRGLRFDKITLLGDSVYLSDFRKVHREVMRCLNPNKDSVVRATCVNPLV